MALTKVTGDFIKAGSITQGHLHSSHGITTSHIAEGDKLFFTNARVDSRVGSLSTSDLSEGTNLYYTDARVDARIAAADTGDLSEGTNLYYTQARFNTAFTAKSTSDLSEGTNLYYTDARADARITAADTDSLSEGSTNLYYTDARADARVALIVDSAPSTLDTLNELAAALGDDANFSTTVTNSIATKLPLAGGALTGAVTITTSSSPGLKISKDRNTDNRFLRFNDTGTSGKDYDIINNGNFAFYNHTDNNYILQITSGGNATFTGTITATGGNSTQWNTAYGWGDHGAAGYLTSFDITTQTDGKYIRSDADDTASGIITLTKNTATGLANNTFSHAKTIIGGIHFANGNGPAANNGNQAAITFQGSSASEAQAGIYVHNNNSQGTHMLFATTDSYSVGPKAGITLLNNGNVTIRGTVGASNFSGSSSGTNTGDQDLSGYATSATTLAGYGITNAIEKGAQIASGASWTTATKFGSTGDLSQAAGNHALSVRSENNNDAFMSFHIGSDYAVHFGLDGATNRMHVGGWSEGTGTQYQLYDSRDFSVASVLNSNVTLATLGYTGATNANYITNNNQLTNGAGYLTNSNDRFYLTDTRSASRAPSYYDDRYIQGDFSQSSNFGVSGGDSWAGILTVSKWSSWDASHRQEQLIFAGTKLARRVATSDTAWSSTYDIIDTSGVNNVKAGYIQSNASLRAPIFYDSNDTGYYLNPASTSNLNALNVGGSAVWTSGNDGSGSGLDADLLDGKDHTQFGATLATYGTTAGSSGRIRCTAPFNTNSGHMFQVTISLYGSYTQHTYIVSAYMYSSTNQWYSPRAIYLGTGSPDIIVGRDANGKAYISIANGNYMGVRVHNMTRGYQTSVADTYDPWTITVDAGTENSVTPSIYNTWTSGNDGSGSGLDADLLDGQHASAFQAAGSYAPAGGSYGTDWYANNLYHDQWVRNHTNSNGHYWDSTGWHLYPRNNEFFYIRSGLTTSTGLAMVCGNETVRGYVYADSSSNIGLLNNAGQWSLQCDNSKNVTAHVSSRAPIFYDSNDTNAYFDANRVVLRGSDPTIMMRDTNNNSAMMHVNSNRWYVLRGGNDTTTWTTTNGHWPLYIQLDNNDAYFGRHLYSLSSMRSPIFYDRDNTAYYGDFASTTRVNLISCAGGLTFPDNYGVGVTGLYSASRIQTIFNMGAAYKLPNDGNSTSNAYGLYWSHQNAGSTGGANNLASHGIIILENGTYKGSWGGGRLVTPSDIRGTQFYDYNNTGYYVNPGSTSNLNVVNTAGAVTTQNAYYSNDGLIYDKDDSSAYYRATGTSTPHGDIFFQSTNSIWFNSQSTSSNYLRLHGGTSSGAYFDFNSTGTTKKMQWRQYGTHTRFTWDYSTAAFLAMGSITANGSDERLKENIVTIDDALNKVKQMRGVYFNRTDIEPDKTRVGFIAQEVRPILPEVVEEAGLIDGYSEFDDNQILTISYANITALIVEAVKEQQTIIDDLKSRIETLENQ